MSHNKRQFSLQSVGEDGYTEDVLTSLQVRLLIYQQFSIIIQEIIFLMDSELMKSYFQAGLRNEA
jgi:hypothetical protein